ncbi:MAG: DUF86 domain-containing protein [Rhizobiaceae bacterium]|nr:DUF86 domain-containing protein [Rhizobiaceae bacterium]
MEADLILQLAVAKAIEWTGELSGRIVKKWPDFVLDHPDIELKGAYLMRNRLAHGYETVDLLTMWETISIDINRMSERLAAFLATIDEQS